MSVIPFKAVAVDMDGTFMRDNRTYDHARFDRLLTKLHQQGIHFIVSSGRPLSRLKEDFAGFLDRIDIISDNGAVLVQDNNIISSHYLTKRTGQDLLNFMQEFYPQAYICVSGKDNAYSLESYPAQFKRTMNFFYPNFIALPSFDEIPSSERIIKLSLHVSAKLSDEIENSFNRKHLERIRCTSSGFNSIDVIPYSVNKAQALKYFLRYFKLDPSQLIAFGDGLNDKEMLQLAGYSYAMANGNPEIIKLARYKAPSNNHDGVFQVLEDYLG